MKPEVKSNTKEAELLLCCSRTQQSASTTARIRELLEQQIDWDYLFNLARRHALLPLLYINLNAVAATALPAEKLTWLKQQYQDNAARNLYLTAELGRVISALEGVGIEAVPYKGPALAAVAYGDVALRRYVDLDVMLRKHEVLRARDVLSRMGYQCHPAWNGPGEKFLLGSQHNIPLSREAGRLLIELHWEVASERFASRLGAEQFWDRLQPLTLNGQKFRTLGAEDLLAALCVHGAKHLWERLAWICDVAELLKANEHLNWQAVLERAQVTGHERMLGLGLYLAKSLLGAPVPDAVYLTVTTDRVIVSLAGEVKARLFNGTRPRPAGVGRTLIFNLRTHRTLSSRIRYCRLVLTPTDADLKMIPLPYSMRSIYYLLRPFRLLAAGLQGSARFE